MFSRTRSRAAYAPGQTTSRRARLLRVALVLVLLALIGGAVMLGFGDVEPVTTPVERTIPDDQLPR